MKKIVLMFSVLLGFVLSGQNLLSNPGFEFWTAGMPDEWTKAAYGSIKLNVYQESTIIHSGSYSAKLALLDSTPTQWIEQHIKVLPNVSYTCSLYVYTEDNHTRLRIYLRWYDTSNSWIKSTSSDYSDPHSPGVWQLLELNDNAPSNAESLHYEIRLYDVSWGDSIDSSISYVDDASLRSVSGIIVPDINTDLVSTHILPYMVSKKITLSIVLKNEGAHSIDLRDISGRTIMSTRKAFKSGINLLNIDTQDLANGIYFLIFDKNLLLGKVVKFE